MPLLGAIKNYLQKAREEADRAHDRRLNSGPAESAGPSACASIPEAKRPLKEPASNLWIGIDLDGTLAHFDGGSNLCRIGPPVPLMLERVKKMLADGVRVKIFTARASDPEQMPLIQNWLKANGLPPLEITNIKDYNMIRLYDDRSIQVEQNTGRIITANGNQGEDWG